jgi:hypothetical protein
MAVAETYGPDPILLAVLLALDIGQHPVSAIHLAAFLGDGRGVRRFGAALATVDRILGAPDRLGGPGWTGVCHACVRGVRWVRSGGEVTR